MTLRKTTLQKLPASSFSPSEWKKVVECVGEAHTEALRHALNEATTEYMNELVTNPRRNTELASDLNLRRKIVKAVDHLLALTENLSARDVLRPASLRHFDDNLGEWFAETLPPLEKNVAQMRDTLRSVRENVQQDAEFYSDPELLNGPAGKERVVGVLLSFWAREVGKSIPKSGKGSVADFVVAAANPILRRGREQIRDANSARPIIRKIAARLSLV